MAEVHSRGESSVFARWSHQRPSFEDSVWTSGAIEVGVNVKALTDAITQLAAALDGEIEARVALDARVVDAAAAAARAEAAASVALRARSEDGIGDSATASALDQVAAAKGPAASNSPLPPSKQMAAGQEETLTAGASPRSERSTASGGSLGSICATGTDDIEGGRISRLDSRQTDSRLHSRLHSRRNSPAPDAHAAAAAHAAVGAIVPADCSQQELKDINEDVIAATRTEQQVDALRNELYAIREDLTKRLDSFGGNYSGGASHPGTDNKIDNAAHVEADAIRHDLFKELDRRFSELGRGSFTHSGIDATACVGVGNAAAAEHSGYDLEGTRIKSDQGENTEGVAAAAAVADILEAAPLGAKYYTAKHDHGVAGNSIAEHDSSEDSMPLAQLREEIALAISGLQDELHSELHDRLCALSAELLNGRSSPTAAATSASAILHEKVVTSGSSTEGILLGVQAELVSLRSEVDTLVLPTRELLNRFEDRLVNVENDFGALDPSMKSLRDELDALTKRIAQFERSCVPTSSAQNESSSGRNNSGDMAANFHKALRCAQKDIEMNTSRVKDLDSIVSALRGRLEVLWPVVGTSLQQQRSGAIATGNALPPANLEIENLFASKEALRREMLSAEEGVQGRLKELREELMNNLRSKANASDLQALALRQRGLEVRSSAAEQASNLRRHSHEDSTCTESPMLTKVPLLPARCMSCDRKVDVVAARPNPWQTGGLPGPPWPQRDPVCPAHHAAGPPPGYRQRREVSLPPVVKET
jgi:hypothetical protein